MTHNRIEKIRSRLADFFKGTLTCVCLFPLMVGPFFIAGIFLEKKEKGFALINNFIDSFGNPSFSKWLFWGMIIYQILFCLMGILTFNDQIKAVEKAKRNKLIENKIGSIRFESNWAFAMGFFTLFLLAVPLFVMGPIVAVMNQLTEAIGLVFSQSSDETIAALSALPRVLKNMGLLVFIVAYDVLIYLISWLFNSIIESRIALKMEIETLKKSCTESKEQL